VVTYETSLLSTLQPNRVLAMHAALIADAVGCAVALTLLHTLSRCWAALDRDVPRTLEKPEC